MKLVLIGGAAIAYPGTLITAYFGVEQSIDSYNKCMDTALATYKTCKATEVSPL